MNDEHDRTMACGHTPEDCDCDPTPEQEERASREESYWDCSDDDDYDDGSCYYCGGARFVVTCCDDICHGQGYCTHGDGNDNCPVCNKDGSREWIE